VMFSGNSGTKTFFHIFILSFSVYKPACTGVESEANQTFYQAVKVYDIRIGDFEQLLLLVIGSN
ncbi:hypothetical protein P6709_20040, partial [Jeotgalibacillus sp. ET6]|uniref:hypothetical protein n=1 Tax=Jeotgalibacillus sp. ET6 TaxID=3037260 RepID=UPI0024188702